MAARARRRSTPRSVGLLRTKNENRSVRLHARHVRASGSMQVRSADVWEKADRAVLRFAPSAFPTLPPIIKRDLDRRRCTVPQPDPAAIGPAPDRDLLHNVIHGHFQSGGQTDWAIVCSRNRVSTILVFWGGRANNVSELAERPDAGFLQ